MDDPGESGAVGGNRDEFDWSETLPSTAVVEVVAATAGCRELDLDSLHGAVDADALDSLVTRDDGTVVSFGYAAHEVTVTGGGIVSARPPE